MVYQHESIPSQLGHVLLVIPGKCRTNNFIACVLIYVLFNLTMHSTHFIYGYMASVYLYIYLGVNFSCSVSFSFVRTNLFW